MDVCFVAHVCYSAVKTSSIEDITQNDLREVQSSGTLKQGEKILADLRKRKLIVQKLGIFFNTPQQSC